MDDIQKTKLIQFSLLCREDIIRMSSKGGCFIGASLSCVDIIVTIYQNYLGLNRNNLSDKNRNIFLLSKGHDVPALYSVMARMGIFDHKRLNNHCTLDDDIYWHPNMKIPGVEFHSGSLGHGLAVGIGFAYFQKLNKLKSKTVVMIGDGEMNEGTIWEGLLTATAKKLNNLIIIIDRNFIQANLYTEDLIPLESIEKKIEAFNCKPIRINGHNFDQIDNALNEAFKAKKPTVIIADTVRGKGLPSIENDPSLWFVHFSEKEVKMLIDELHGLEEANLKSEKLLVR